MSTNRTTPDESITAIFGSVFGLALLAAAWFLFAAISSCLQHGNQPIECSLATNMCIYDATANLCPLEKGIFGYKTIWQ